MRTRMKITGVVAGATLAALATVSPAQAEPPPPGCPRGYFCTAGEPGAPTAWKTAGNWTGETYAIYMINNGYPGGGVDHVYLTYYRAQDGSGPYTRCLHYYPGPGDYSAYHPNDPIKIVKIRWGGEC